jgi:hypothetical protein
LEAKVCSQAEWSKSGAVKATCLQLQRAIDEKVSPRIDIFGAESD